MKIQFHGAARQVTGSKHLIITEQGTRILLDCGLFQGLNTHELNQNFAFNPEEIDYVILSHAHIDHTGLLPRLVAKGFSGPIYCTDATKDLAVILLGDSARIQENDLNRINKRRANRGEELLENLYSADDVEQTISQMISVNFREKVQICEEVSAYFTDTGHILGSAAVSLTIKEGEKDIKLFFSGDIGRPNDKILKNPEAFPQADYIICESTYGAKLHEKETDVKAHLQSIVQRVCVEQKGKLLIPAFSVDRTQELVYALDQLAQEGQLPPIKVFVDSPLSVNATYVMKKHPECFNPEILEYLKHGDGDAFGFPNLYYVSSTDDSKKLNDLKEPCIIISSSGMAEAGRIKHHIANNIEDIRCCILLVGYTTADSLGGQLKAGNKKVTIFGDQYDVRAEVVVMDSFSAHADYQEIIEFLSCQEQSQVKEVFLVHGEYETQQIFRQKLIDIGWNNVTIPAMREEVILN
ncbi:metallo-beta-lactamase family protein [Pseudarcicella hirudinis]|uniref:Metallo-beta-lactamase family protein n=1 Tax=Pseudarcicella hirudinis TaxID=1079859 RepID=A0A1I5XK91_9BACT|nr:MBL fold metallo-hydrolase [Pseudarcicella hirudinis]SFQ32340.1 metallo-beta-lactamase family protein [Pseudarcicella hirudinis]